MATLYNLFLFGHIVAGTLALLSGTVSLIRRKGDKKHRLIGNIFLYSMLLVGASAFFMAITKPNYFLFMVGIFSTYLVGTGIRILYLKQIPQGQKPLWLDWLLSLAMLVFGLAFIFSGLRNIINTNYFGIAYVVFGSIGSSLVAQDFALYFGKVKLKNYWLYMHITRMVAGNIAAFTAFLVVNNTILPALVAWLLPTVIGSAVIAYYQIKYKTKLNKLPLPTASPVALA